MTWMVRANSTDSAHGVGHRDYNEKQLEALQQPAEEAGMVCTRLDGLAQHVLGVAGPQFMSMSL
jgi:hypothetical protein